MTSPKALVKLAEFPLFRKDFENIPTDQTALLGIISFAVSEINALSRLYLSAEQEFKQDDAIDHAVFTQMFIIVRSWSSRLFELTNTFTELSKGRNTKDSVVIDLAKKIMDDLESPDTSAGQTIVRNIRNEAASHYPFEAAKKNVRHISEGANLKMYLHALDGNSFYPMGEALMFEARFHRHAQTDKREQAHSALFQDWLDWNLAASKWARRAHLAIFEEIVITRFPNRFAREKTFWVDPEMVGDVRGSRVPVFFREDN